MSDVFFDARVLEAVQSAGSMYEKAMAIQDAFASRHEYAPKDENCPQCGHHKTLHIAASCYLAGPRGWHHACISYLGEGNAYGLPAGWQETDDWKRNWYVHPGTGWWEQ